MTKIKRKHSKILWGIHTALTNWQTIAFNAAHVEKRGLTIGGTKELLNTLRNIITELESIIYE